MKHDTKIPFYVVIVAALIFKDWSLVVLAFLCLAFDAYNQIIGSKIKTLKAMEEKLADFESKVSAVSENHAQFVKQQAEVSKVLGQLNIATAFTSRRV